MKRIRRAPSPGEFQDPLSNYDPQDYADNVEKALATDELSSVDHTPVATAKPEELLRDVIKRMVDNDYACVMIVNESDHPIGVFSERDFLNKVSEDFAAASSRKMSEVMTPDPMVVHRTDPPGEALAVMAVGSFRHVPLVDVDEKLVGIVGPKRMSKYLHELLDQQ